MIVLSLHLSEGSEMDPYLYYCGEVSLQIMCTWGLHGGLCVRWLSQVGLFFKLVYYAYIYVIIT
jgi:hypothetical protein